jgi:hypothetical protein
LSVYIGFAFTRFETDIANITDKFDESGLALAASIGFERRLFKQFCIIGELNYNVLNCDVEGTIGTSTVMRETTLHSSGFDITGGIGYEFEL